jgi:hypothetical protein
MNMKTIISIIALGFATSAMAAPKATCQLHWYTVDENGTALETAVSAAQEVTVQNHLKMDLKGYEQRTYMKQNCASDGGPCSDIYELMTTISKGDVSTSTLTLSTSKRQYVNLAVGNEIVFTICDLVNE